MFDVCVVGHITRDLIRIPGKADRAMAGGSAYYVSIALRNLGLRVAVVTKVQRDDEDTLLRVLEEQGIEVFNGVTETTTVFENVYADASLASRKQWVRSVARPFLPEDVDRVDARAFHIGPLTGSEVTLPVLEAVRRRAEMVALDGQGMLRRVANEAVRLESWPEAASGLPLVDILKVDDIEAAHLVGHSDANQAAHRLAELGVGEVLVTFSDRGSVVHAHGFAGHIPAVRPEKCVDATGCGDTYAAGYLYSRLQGAGPIDAAWFAAATASLKLERYGPFEGTSQAVEARLNEAKTTTYGKIS